MNGFSLSYWNEPHDTDPGWRFAIVVETDIAFRSEMVWRRSELVALDPSVLMRKIEMAIGVREGRLEGFTLFYHPGKGWQMSTRRKGESGWSIEQGLPDEQVRPIFDLLEPHGHPDGPHQLMLPKPTARDLPALIDRAATAHDADTVALAAWVAL